MTFSLRYISVAFGALVFIGAPNAYAYVLQDNFNSDTPSLNWTGDSVFVPVPMSPSEGYPSVDLVGGSNFGNLAFSGNSVDLDGSTGTGFSPSGELQSVMSLAAGFYTVQFEFAGNLRSAPIQTTTVSIGNKSFALTPTSANMPYTLETLVFDTTTAGQLTFVESGPASQQGSLIDNVTVSTGVPELSTWTLMLVGFAGLGFAGFRSQRKETIPV